MSKPTPIVSGESPGPGYYGEWEAPYLCRWYPRRPGYVYVVDFGDGIYKIGKTTDVDSRRRAFGPHKLVLVLEEWADVHRYERKIHRRFAHRRLYGELFRLAPDDLIELSEFYGTCSGLQWEGKR